MTAEVIASTEALTPVVPVAPSAATNPALTGDSDESASGISVNAERLKAFADVPLRVTIEIGRLQVFLKELLELKPGYIFRIKKAVGEPFDICANGQAVARGEVIVVENSSGVRITEVLKL